MLFTHPDELLAKARTVTSLTRQEERDCAIRMNQGDEAARERLLLHCLPAVAGCIRRAPSHYRTLGLAYACLHAAQRAVDTFPFDQDGETFAHRLSWHLRQAVTRYIALHNAEA